MVLTILPITLQVQRNTTRYGCKQILPKKKFHLNRKHALTLKIIEMDYLRIKEKKYLLLNCLLYLLIFFFFFQNNVEVFHSVSTKRIKLKIKDILLSFMRSEMPHELKIIPHKSQPMRTSNEDAF